MGYPSINPIDGLYRVLDEDMVPGDDPAPEFFGFFVQPQGNGRYHVQYDGHVGSVLEFHRDDYNDVMELVHDLTRCIVKASEFDYQEDREGLVDWAGKIMTRDKERAEENPDIYIHIPPADGVK